MATLSVLHVINCVTPTGGAEVSTVQTLPLLAASGVRQGLVTLHPNTDAEAVARLREAGVVLFEGDEGRWPGAVGAVRAAIRDFRPDVVHSVLWEADRAARPAARLAGVPALTSLVNAPAPDQRLPRRIAWKVAVLAGVDRVMARRLTTGFHAITHAVADHGVSRLGVPRERITVVPRGRDRVGLGEPSPDRRKTVRRRLGLDESAPVLLNVGRQERQKGQVLLLQAFREVLSTRPDAVLLVAGRPGAATTELQREHARLALGESVRFLGARDDVPDLLSAADAFLFSSLWEGLGGSVLEAMALEVPVVAFDVAAVAEVLGGQGWLVPTGDTAALGAATLAVLDDATEARERALRARGRFESEYAMDAVISGMLAFYRRHAGGAGGAA